MFLWKKIQNQKDIENLPLQAITKELIGIIEKSGSHILLLQKNWQICKEKLKEIYQALSDEIQGDNCL